jgi:hypothetical protein
MQAQKGLCYYCEHPMWQQNIKQFRRDFNMTETRAAMFKCTAEHLIARRDQGPTNDVNIVAACLGCNQKRHEGETALAAEDFKIHIRQNENFI